LANAYRVKGEAEKAQKYYEQVIATRDRVERSATQVKFYGGINIALSLAWLGRFDEALALVEQLANDNPPANDALLGSGILAPRAMIRGLAGNQEAAIEDLEIALESTNAFPLTAWDLYYDPNWDFMRDNPRFVELATPPVTIRTTP
jgi:tetratricopeptide (TPR) repeat protein